MSKKKVKHNNNIFYAVLIVVSIVLAVLIIFNVKGYVSGKVVASEVAKIDQLLTESENMFTIEYDIPSYLPEQLRHPQKFFSGRKIRIIEDGVTKPQKVYGEKVTLEKRNQATKATLSSKVLQVEQKRKSPFPSIIIPKETEAGYYTISFQKEGKTYLLPLWLEGQSIQPVAQSILPLDPSISFIKRLGCGFCWWESVLAMDPQNEDYGYFVGGGASDNFVQTKDGWKTNIVSHIDQITNPFLKYYRGDPKFAFTKDNRLLLTSLFVIFNSNPPSSEPITGGFYEQSASQQFPTSLKQTVLRDVPLNLDPSYWILFDYPKIASDTNPNSPYLGTTYISVNGLYFEDVNPYYGDIGTGLYIIRDGDITVKRTALIGMIQPPVNLLVGNSGAVYASRLDIRDSDGMEYLAWLLYLSKDGGNTFQEYFINKQNTNQGWCTGKIASTSNRAWFIHSGPTLAYDKTKSRLYASWAQFDHCIEDPAFEFEHVAIDYDIYVSYSDDDGRTWSSPVRVNDDSSGGDQGFPSITVDSDGVVYVAFFDHRDNQDKAQYDVYYAKSLDNGKTFSKNIRINDISIPNGYGWRDPGDYWDMISVGKNNIYIAHPCVDPAQPPNLLPTDSCVTVIKKVIPPSTCNLIPQCGNNLCQAGESCEFNIVLNRQMMCNGQQSKIPPGKICTNCQIVGECGNGICSTGENCEWNGKFKRQMLCDGKQSVIPAGKTCSNCKIYGPCGNGICEADEGCEWYGAEKRQMLCDGKKTKILTGQKCADCKLYGPAC